MPNHKPTPQRRVVLPFMVSLARLRAILGPEAPRTDEELAEVRANLYSQAELLIAIAKREQKEGRHESRRLLPR